MNWQYTVFTGLAGILSLSLAFLAWSHRRARGAVYFILLMIAVSVWSLSNAVESMPWNVQTKILWSQISYIGVVSVGPLWLLLTLNYSQHLRHWTSRHILLLWIVPLVILVLVATNQHHGLIWTQVTPVSDAPGALLIYGRGIGFWINVVYIYVSMLAGSILLIRTTLRSTQLYRRQIWALLLGALLPWIGNLWYLLRLPPLPELEKAPIGFALSGLSLAYGLFRLRLFDIVPVARDTLIENMPDGVLVLDEYDRLVDINPAACQLLGWEATQIVGQPIAVILARWSDLAERYQDRHQVQTEIAINPNRWFDLNISALYNRQQQLSGRLVVLRDITARKQAEQALHESEANFHAFFETMTDMIVVGAPDGRILFTNSAVSKTLGYNASELVGMHILDLHPADKRAEATGILTAMFRGEREVCPLPLARRDGTLVPVETRVWMGRWDGQECIFGLSKNLTAEQEAQQRFERLFRNNPALMALSTLPGRRFFDVNNAFLNATSYAREEVIGRTAAELGLFVHPEAQQQVAQQLLAQGHIANVETQIRCKDDTIRDGLFWGETISSQGHDYFLTVMIDVTERKQVEKALQDSEQQYRELYATAQRQMHELSLLNQVRTTLARELDLPTIFHDVVEAIAETFGYTLVSLYLRQDDELVLQHQVGYTRVFKRIPVTQGVSGQVARIGEPILLQDVHTDPAFLEAVPNIASEVCVPLIDQGQTVGVLNVESNDLTPLTEADLALLVALGEHITIAMERARLYAQIRERERHLDLFFTQSMDGFFFMLLDEPVRWDETVDKEQVLDYVFTHQRITRANDAMLAQYGTTREQFLGRTPDNFFAYNPIHGRAVWRSFFDAGHLHIDTDERKLDGTSMWVEGDYVCLYDTQGRITGHFGVQRDVTEQRRIVRALEDREHFLAALNDITQAALETSDLTAMLQILADRMGGLFQADGCYLTLWDEARQQTVAGAAYGAWRDRYRAVQIAPDEPTVTASVLRTGHTLAIEDVYHTPYLSLRIAKLFPGRSLLGLPLIAAEHKLGAALIVFNETHVFTPLEIARGEQVARQIALAIARARLYQELQAYAGQLEERVRTRTAELQAQYAQLDAILRSVDDVIFMTDPERRILYVNPAFTVQTGYTSADVLGQTVCALGILGNFESLTPSILPTLTQGKVWHGEVLGQRKDGRTYDAALTITPVHDEAELITGYVFTHRDISQAKDLERARDQFITNISHQFLTPLTPLKTGIYLLQRTVQSEKQQQQLTAMERGTNWLIQLVKDILEISVLDSGKGVEVWDPVSPLNIVREVLERYQNQAQTAGLILKAAPVLSDLPVIEGDARRLLQALSELVENAIVFTPAGGEVSVAVQTDIIEGENWVTIAVHDTGPGITPEELPRLFERFFRGSLAESGHTAGTGLGLSIAQKIAEAHGGRITVESAVGQGSTFTLWLRPVLYEG